ncbi:hypothetical protein K438DRAFT_1978668 [Mycena galopus ATCC 62051]|nr:hypothetical protein K438DRAFT_1978668 [Mycena galopus ATCC 62051]
MFRTKFLMHLATLALLIIPTSGQEGLNFTCNPAGVPGDCSAFTTTFCSSVANDLIAQGDTSARCFTTSTKNLKCDFTAINTVPGNNIPTALNCETVLASVSVACPMGGNAQLTGGDFIYFIDPNTGVCSPQCSN